MTRRLYVVTGAKGFLGNVLVRALTARGDSVVGLVLPGDDMPSLEGVPCTLVSADICDGGALEAALVRAVGKTPMAEVVLIHTAGIVSIATRDSARLTSVNVQGTANVVRFCQEHGVGRLVYVSSVHAIPERPHGETMEEVAEFDPGQTVGPYARTKAAATALVLEAARAGLDAIVVHPSGMAGPGDYGRTHFTQLVLDYLRGRLVAYVVGGYDFVDVRDVTDGILAVIEQGRRGECYILSNRYISTEELFTHLHTISGRRPVRVVLPMALAKATAGLSELYYRILRQPPLFTGYSLYTLESNSLFSHAKASAELGYVPRPLERTLADTITWLKTQGRV